MKKINKFLKSFKYRDNNPENDPKTWGQFIRSYLWERPLQSLIIVLIIISIAYGVKRLFIQSAKIVIPGGTEINIKETQSIKTKGE